jgi:hypothetical protein
MDFVYLQYHIHMPGGREFTHKLRLDPNSWEIVEATPDQPPAWTALTHRQCPNCPLTSPPRAHCPAALGLARVLDHFTNVDAFLPTQTEVTTPERVMVAKVPLQKALSSLAGLIMATSGCPRTAFLRPMARFHLPFANDDETLYRATSMYLLAQYLIARQGGGADYEMNGLVDRYRELQTVNTAMAERLKEAYGKPGAQTLVNLDLFSHNLPYDIRSELSRLRKLFHSLLS